MTGGRERLLCIQWKNSIIIPIISIQSTDRDSVNNIVSVSMNKWNLCIIFWAIDQVACIVVMILIISPNEIRGQKVERISQ